MRTFGTAALVKERWRLDCEPHVAMRLKRVFAQARQRKGTIFISATPETCREIEWFCERFPLEFSDGDRLELELQARTFDSRIRLVGEILSGEYQMPDFGMVLPPRDYQKQAATLWHTAGALLLADDLGLGKTVSALAGVSVTKALPALIVCPVHLQVQWAREAWRFLKLEAHIAKKGTPYDLGSRPPDVLVMSYHKLNGWQNVLAGKYPTVVFDECQELRIRGSNKYQAADHVASSALYRIGLSATPIYNYGGEFWSVMNVLFPGALGSFDEFLAEWCVHSYGERKARIKDPPAFGSYLRESAMMLRRTRKDVARELPALTRVVQEVSCDLAALDEVKTSASELAKIILSQQGMGFDKMKAASELDFRLRQATGIAKAPYVAEFVRMLLADGDPVVLFGWHRTVYSIWQERLAEFKPAFYTGKETPNQKQREFERFTKGDTPLLIISLRSGAGLDGLQHTCSRVVIGELDWSPGALEQCIGRVHRDGQTDPVFAYYLLTNDGTDPVIADTLQIKSGQIEGVRDPEGQVVFPKEVDPDHIKKLARAYLSKGEH